MSHASLQYLMVMSYAAIWNKNTATFTGIFIFCSKNCPNINTLLTVLNFLTILIPIFYLKRKQGKEGKKAATLRISKT